MPPEQRSKDPVRYAAPLGKPKMGKVLRLKIIIEILYWRHMFLLTFLFGPQMVKIKEEVLEAFVRLEHILGSVFLNRKLKNGRVGRFVGLPVASRTMSIWQRAPGCHDFS